MAAMWKKQRRLWEQCGDSVEEAGLMNRLSVRADTGRAATTDRLQAHGPAASFGTKMMMWAKDRIAVEAIPGVDLPLKKALGGVEYRLAGYRQPPENTAGEGYCGRQKLQREASEGTVPACRSESPGLQAVLVGEGRASVVVLVMGKHFAEHTIRIRSSN